MKRLLLLLALLASAVLCSIRFETETAKADGRRYVFESIRFRRWLATGAIDSTWVYSKANTPDTTAPYPLEFARIPEAQFMAPMGALAAGSPAHGDSVTWFSFHVGSAGPTAIAVDSIYVGQQVSQDGISWVTVTNNQTFLAAATIPPVASAILIEATTSNQFGRRYKQAVDTLGTVTMVLNGATAPSDVQMAGWRYIRWIVTWGTEAAQPCQAWVGRWAE